MPEHRGLRMLFRALCEAMTSAVDLANGDPCLLAISPLLHRLRDRLVERAEFTLVGSSPFPVVAKMDDTAALADRICRRFH